MNVERRKFELKYNSKYTHRNLLWIYRVSHQLVSILKWIKYIGSTKIQLTRSIVFFYFVAISNFVLEHIDLSLCYLFQFMSFSPIGCKFRNVGYTLYVSSVFFEMLATKMKWLTMIFFVRFFPFYECEQTISIYSLKFNFLTATVTPGIMVNSKCHDVDFTGLL